MTMPKEEIGSNEDSRKPVRVYFDGCFDCLHYGHANALRQAREMGDVLIVGIHSDSDITKHKGRPPVCPEAERYQMIRAIKWVDEVVEGATFLPDVDHLERHNCDFCVHGDDKSFNADGGDSYRLLKAVGRYKECKRTSGISTTDIIKRLLLLTAERPHNEDEENTEQVTDVASSSSCCSNRQGIPSKSLSAEDVSHFLPTSQLIAAFSSGREAKDTERIVYVAGDFDIFNVEHLELLEKARNEGDFLLVGIHSDDIVRSYRGANFPLMDMMERAMTILACKYVSDVIIGAPFVVTLNLMDRFRVDVVCHGQTTFLQDFPLAKCYKEPMNRGKFKKLHLSSYVNSSAIINRIRNRRFQYPSTVL